MQRLYKNIGFLDKRLVSEFGLSEDLMMEHASSGLNSWIRKHLPRGKSVQILCGLGNNGADGIACARMLKSDYKVSIFLPLGAKSKMAKIQLERAKKLGIKEDKKLKKASLYVDAIFGSGLTRPLNEEIVKIIKKVNSYKSIKLSCDIPTGIMENGNVQNVAFQADTTITMGALKSSLFSDKAKDFVGKIKVCDLGVSRDIYELETDTYLLDEKDLKLPLRDKKGVNKGSFGHLAVISGEKQGASILCASAGFCFGAGLVTLVSKNMQAPEFLMQSEVLPKNTTALCAGMGIEEISHEIKKLLQNQLPTLYDAGILTNKELPSLLYERKDTILTPHPKEFSLMSKNLGFGEFSVEEIQANRVELAREFSLKFPHVLVLKGANTIVAKNGICYISTFGTSALAKGGSGDVLAGLIGSLLAQGKSPLKSAIDGVLAHGLSAKKFSKNSYSLTPNDIIEGVKCL